MNSTKLRLCVMMFLQFFAWGAWFATLGKCLADNSLQDFGAGAYGSAPLAAILAPLFLGLVADRLFPSQIIMGVLLLLGGVFLCLVPGYAEAGNGRMLVNLCIAHMLCYMPTVGLGNTIVFANVADSSDFPRIRVWGTIGWIVAGLFVGFQNWSGSFHIFWVGGITSAVCGLYCLTLPNTPPPAQGKPIDVRAIFMLDAFGMLLNLPFLIFIICSALICIPLSYYYGLSSNLLGQIGFEAPAATLTLGQMSEIFFMLLVPFFFRRLGVKWMILVGMAAWVARYFLFALGAPELVTWMILLGVLLHGVCYDFFFVTGFMYTDDKAPQDIRGQAQSMLIFFTQGIGMYVGYAIAYSQYGSTVTNYEQLNKAIQAGASQAELSFTESLTRMFTVSRPEGLDQQLLSETMLQWKQFWLVPGIMAAVVLVAFALLFRDKMNEQSSA